jgi:hypothetical protein
MIPTVGPGARGPAKAAGKVGVSPGELPTRAWPGPWRPGRRQLRHRGDPGAAAAAASLAASGARARGFCGCQWRGGWARGPSRTE